MRHARHFMDVLVGEEVVEPGVPIHMDPALVVGQMLGGMLAFANRAELVPRSWGRLAIPWPFIPDIGPDEGCYTLLFGLHLDGRVIREDGCACPNMSTDGVGQRFQKLCGLPDPSCQSRSVKIDPLALHDLALPIQRAVVRVFAYQNMRQKTGARAATLNRARGQWRLNNLVAAFAGHARAHNPVHDEAARDVFQLFGHIFPDGPQGPAAFAGLTWAQHLFMARQFWRQRLALWFLLRLGIPHLFRRCGPGGSRFFLFEPELKVQLVRRLRFGPKTMPIVARQLMLQLLDLKRRGLCQFDQTFRRDAKLAGIGWKGFGCIEHGPIYN